MSTNRPTFLAFAVKNRGRNQTAIWTRIGAAWLHTDSIGYSIELDALPIDGRIVLREPKLEDEPAEDAGNSAA